MKAKRPYWEMTTAELREATRRYDAEMPGLPGRPLRAAGKRDMARARRRGRPPIGLGAEKIRVSVERSLLIRTDAAARKWRVSRSELIARGLEEVLKRAGR